MLLFQRLFNARGKALSLGIMILAACSGKAKTPLDAVERYHSGNALHNGRITSHRVLQEDSLTAIYATVIERDSSSREWYTFLRYDGKEGWLVEASKTLDLNVASDSSIKAYLQANKPIFDSIVDLFSRRAVLSSVDVSDTLPQEIRDGKVLSTNRSGQIHKALQETLATRVFRDFRYSGCTFVRLDGFNREEVGYIYSPEGCVLPRMSPDQFIYVDRVTDDWFVYKVI